MNRIWSKLIYTLILLGITINPFAQVGKRDSLWASYNQSRVDSVRVDLLFQIGDTYKFTKPDSALLLYDMGIELTTKQKINPRSYKERKANSIREIGIELRRKSEFGKAIEFFESSIALFIELGDTLKQSSCYQNIGNVYFNIGNFDIALEHYFKALHTFESANNLIGMADCYNNIGSVHKELGSMDKAVEFHLKSKEIFVELFESADTTNRYVVTRGLSYAYNNLGIAFWYQKLYNESISHYEKSLLLKELINDLSGMAQCLNNIAIVYSSQGLYQKGIENFEKALGVYEKLNNLNGLAMVNGNIAYLNILLADSASGEIAKHNFLKRALRFGHTSFDIAKQIGALPLQLEAVDYLKDAYTRMNNSTKALEFANMHIELQKELFSKEKANALAETTTKYEAEKKQLQIDNMEKEKELFQKRIYEQKIIIVFTIVTLVLLLVYTITIFRFLQQKRLANNILAERNEEILQQKEEITAQVDELEEQRGKLEESKKEIESLYHVTLEQKNTLQKQKEKIDDSIRYANFIQTAVLPDLDITFVNRSWGTQSYFIMFRPKDVVSGDFYWATRIDEWIIVAVVDCTGHGVPGAFMSMLGVSFLNEIVLKADIIRPANILRTLRSYIIGALKQKDEWGSQRDGMDMSLISINTKTKQCYWAGANSPLWIVRANQEKTGPDFTPHIEEIKPNPIPVAVHVFMTEFTDHMLQLNSGDKIYMFSDGFPDQFGGPNGKKYNMHKAFRKLIAQTSILPMKEQGRLLESTFDKWINYDGNEYEQIDDVTVLGIMI